jgi:hypothetical protein
MVAQIGDSTELRDWIACMVCSLTKHLDQLGIPTWYGRFATQALADLDYQMIVVKDALASPPLMMVVAMIARSLDGPPIALVTERHAMVRNLVMHTCADFERAFAEGTAIPRTSWSALASGASTPCRTVAGTRHGGPLTCTRLSTEKKCMSGGSVCGPARWRLRPTRQPSRHSGRKRPRRCRAR